MQNQEYLCRIDLLCKAALKHNFKYLLSFPSYKMTGEVNITYNGETVGGGCFVNRGKILVHFDNPKPETDRQVLVADRNLNHTLEGLRTEIAYVAGDLLLAIHSNMNRDGADMIEHLYKERRLIGFKDFSSPSPVYSREQELEFLRAFCDTLDIGDSEFPPELREKIRGIPLGLENLVGKNVLV